MTFGIWNNTVDQWLNYVTVIIEACQKTRYEFLTEQQAEMWLQQYRKTWDINKEHPLCYDLREHELFVKEIE